MRKVVISFFLLLGLIWFPTLSTIRVLIFILRQDESHRHAIRVARVVVVAVAVVVHVPEVGRVGWVRRTQPPVVGGSLDCNLYKQLFFCTLFNHAESLLIPFLITLDYSNQEFDFSSNQSRNFFQIRR